MMGARIFEVDEVRDLTGDGSRWLVRGRAYDDIETSDILNAEASDQAVRLGQPLVVIAMSSYRRDTPILSRMMTGDLTLQGQIGDDLVGVKYLHLGEKIVP